MPKKRSEVGRPPAWRPMTVAKASMRVRRDGERQAWIEFSVPVESAADVPHELEAAYHALANDPATDELRSKVQPAPVNMRCRVLPPDELPGGSEQWLPEVQWRKLRLVRNEGRIYLMFRVALGLDQSVWAWLYDSFGNQIVSQVEGAQRELGLSTTVEQLPGGIQ